jgi:pSer/pThr/pTyr-binding forkhead associated (FHA) protein
MQKPLVIVDVDTNQKYELTGKALVSIGRDADNDIPLRNDPAAVSCHALLTFAKDGYWLEDLGTSCGTFVNHERIEKAVSVTTGDTILIGRTRLVVQ